MDEDLKQYTAFTVGNLEFFECEPMPFGLCNAPATFQRLMQNCLGELSLMYCLIYLDNVIVLSKAEEEHLKCLHIVFDCFQEHYLRLKLPKYKFFWEEINYLAHHVSKEGMQPIKESKIHPELTPKSKPTWAWWGTISDSSRGLHMLHNLYMSIYLGEVTIRRVNK